MGCGMSFKDDDSYSKTLILWSCILSLSNFYALLAWLQPAPLEKCFPDFMPFLGGPHKNVNLGFYIIGFVNKTLSWSTSSSVTKITDYQMFD